MKSSIKLSLFRDKKDIEREITKDKVINIIGLIGSGKTTLSEKYINDKRYLVVSTDRFYNIHSNVPDSEDMILLKKYFQKKYKEVPKGNDFIDCYNDIIKYAFKLKRVLVIEGNSLNCLKINQLKGKLIIKRTSIIKSFIRSLKREYNNRYHMNLEKEKHPITFRLIRLYKIVKRRKSIFKEKSYINKILEQE